MISLILKDPRGLPVKSQKLRKDVLRQELSLVVARL